MADRDKAIQTLRDSFQEGNLALYLGAGVSVGNGLPTWERLVQAVYFAALNEVHMGGWRPFANYLYAISEWHLERDDAPLEITARKVRGHFDNQEDFLRILRETLYAAFMESETGSLDPGSVRMGNPTLDAVARLCETKIDGRYGVRSVITYNYDMLLEAVLDRAYESIWDHSAVEEGTMPIYHVHGMVGMALGEGSAPDDIIFTEDQYNLASQDSYSWSNLVQINTMSSSIGLMVGLSLSDRNMRRLLDAVMRTPMRSTNFALVQRHVWPPPDAAQLDKINERAIQYLEQFERSGVKRAGVKGPSWQDQVLGILEQVQQVGTDQHEQVLGELGIVPIWYRNHSEIPDIVREILA